MKGHSWRQRMLLLCGMRTTLDISNTVCLIIKY